MSQAQVPDQCALAVPGKISCEIRERDFFVGESAKSNVSNDARLEAIRPKIVPSRKPRPQAALEIQCSASGSPSPNASRKAFKSRLLRVWKLALLPCTFQFGAACKTAHVIAPFAMCDIQLLVVPFCGHGEVSHFVAAPLQSITAECRLDARLLDLGDVAAKFYL